MSMSEKQRSDLSSAIFRLFMAAEEGAIDVDQTTFTLKELASGSSVPRARRKAPCGDFSKLHASPFEKALVKPQNPEVMIKKLLDLSQMYGWGFTPNDVPSVPEFTPRTIHEVLMPMLHLPSQGMKSSFTRTFEELWKRMELPRNWHRASMRISTDPSRLRQPDDYGCFPGISWVVFDPVGLVNESVASARKKAPRHQLQLAGLECLLAVDFSPIGLRSSISSMSTRS